MKSISKKDQLEVINNIFNGLEEYWINLEGIIVATNLEAVTISGYQESEIIGKHISVLFTKDIDLLSNIRSENYEIIADELHTETTLLKRKDGTKFIGKITITVISKDGSNSIRMTVQDRTYKTIQRKRMKQLESHFNSLFHNRFIGVIHLQRTDLKIILANVKACEILGDFDFTEKYFNQYLHENTDVNRLFDPAHSQLTDDIEAQLIQPSKQKRWVSIHKSDFSSEGLIELLLFDMTEDRKRIANLERINQQLDQFIYHISHDLRAPLTTLMGLISISRNELESMTTLQGYLELMLQRVIHLDSILIDLMSIAVNEKTILDLQPIHIEKEITSVLNQYEEVNSLIHVKLNVFQPVEFTTDVKRLRIIIRNLVSNSIKYRNSAQENPHILIKAIVDSDCFFLEVEDNGIGIHPKHYHKIYDMFFRGTEQSSGSGLGLYIVKSIVDKLGGQITFFSYPEKNTVFKITLPNKSVATNSIQNLHTDHRMEKSVF